MSEDIFTLPLVAQIALGAGYMAYMLSSAGLQRGHTAIDVLMRSLAFGLPAMGVFILISESRGALTAGSVAVVVSLVCGGIWRAWLGEAVHESVKRLGIHQDDYRTTALDSWMSSKSFSATQINVRLNSGRELFCENLKPYLDGPERGLLVGNDGGIVMVVDVEVAPDGTETNRTSIKDEQYGTRVTYIPPEQIEYFELRVP